MKRQITKWLCFLFGTALLLSTAGCTTDTSVNYDAPALVQSILSQVQFDTELTSSGDLGALYFSDLPAGAVAEVYSGSGYFADEVSLITLKSQDDMAAGTASAKAHVQAVRKQFANYIPAELDKIDHAVIWSAGKYIIVCITNDYANAKKILNNAADPSYRLPTTSEKPTDPTLESTEDNTVTPTVDPTVEPTVEPTAEPTEEVTVAPTVEPTVEPTNEATEPGNDNRPTVRPDGYPAIYSQSGKYYNYGNGVIRVDNMAFETTGYSDSSASSYAALVNKVADALAGKTTVYDLAIPTSIGVMLPDDIQDIYPNYINQGNSIEKLYSKLSSQVKAVRCFDNLMSHRDEYLYFRTDHHWNGIGAYYAYEAFCETKGITPYTMGQRKEKQFSNFLGTLYFNNSGKDPALLPADTVFAYLPHSSSASMEYYDKNGKGSPWPIISDVSGWAQSSKYSTFAGSDQPLSIFKNPEVTDGSVCIVVKESYGNALLPYLVDHYSVIYEIDYRHWSGNLVEYAQQVGATDLIFANNIQMISTSYLVGLLSKIIP